MEPLPELYAIFQGEVAAVTDYGAFIKIPGCRKQGLVHRTHMSSCRVDKPSEIVDVGDKVWVKLIGKEMKDDKLKLSLSMKVVNQGTGKDLDPNNVALDQDERKKRSFRDYTSQKITLEAVLNTVCKKCGCKGHFAKECFMQPGGTKYSLIPEEEEDEEAAAGHGGDNKTSLAEEPSKKRKKEKKKKKKHKAKESSETDSSSSDSDSSGAQPSSKRSKHSKAPKKKKKKKKHRK
ncbi:nucleolar protein of 40 kDa [Chiroxiphia lanceolata]|uniref:nucleolar protein of 40 kDa n=1 Tax=Chiroxiphia lanceolata TaxID=296741 RepID=UPI0013CEAB69|nr:nucleolar protein of 40 kDa [Chiroxiphia lanceolata]XP_032566015.1 nucleolar protein of 40 kDa [Chiroxiphia lanceolata]XP_032566016.1 nucleolar protein of 40 kDa [Chiroxiphia lanceolata]XP_032566017.1 nucleolar protein of 40 kDa [Chiroxiphia lanceolata]